MVVWRRFSIERLDSVDGLNVVVPSSTVVDS